MELSLSLALEQLHGVFLYSKSKKDGKGKRQLREIGKSKKTAKAKR